MELTNISEILKNCTENTILYSPIYGNAIFTCG